MKHAHPVFVCVSFFLPRTLGLMRVSQARPPIPSRAVRARVAKKKKAAVPEPLASRPAKKAMTASPV